MGGISCACMREEDRLDFGERRVRLKPGLQYQHYDRISLSNVQDKWSFQPVS